MLKVLWTYENQAKADPFLAILQERGILFETQSTAKTKTQNSEIIISVDDREYEKAKKCLVKHRRRKTTS